MKCIIVISDAFICKQHMQMTCCSEFCDEQQQQQKNSRNIAQTLQYENIGWNQIKDKPREREFLHTQNSLDNFPWQHSFIGSSHLSTYFLVFVFMYARC